MAFELTFDASLAVDKTSIEPTYVFCIEGLDFCYTAVEIQKYIRWGDEDLFFGDDWVYGGVNALEGQKTYVSLENSTRKITQQIQPDKGSVSSVSSITVRVIDKNNEVSEVISRNIILNDILGKRADLWVGFRGTAFKDDYIKIFSGLISDVVSGPGFIEFTVNHPDEKKRSRLFEKYETVLVSAIDNVTTTITLEDASGFILPSDSLRSFVKIEDEFIEYTGISGNQLTGVTRGALVSIDPRAAAASHAIDTNVESFYILEDRAIDLALKLMLSKSGFFAEDVPILSFVLNENSNQTPNSVYFKDIRLNRDYGLVPGDKITITGATNGSNNVTDVEISQIVSLEEGDYAILDATLIFEDETSAVAKFQSKYDVLTEGLGMDPRDVDVKQHEFIRDTFVSSYDLRFYLKDTIDDAKEFIEQEIYVPFSGYSLPRGTRSSLGLHIAPFPFDQIRTLSKKNIKNASSLRLRRSFAKNFYNAIVFRFDEDLYDDKFLRGVVTFDAQSREETGRRKDFVITSKGLRTDLQGASNATVAASRLLDRYRRGAEFFEQVEVFFSEGIRIEPGDAIIFDPEGLNITDTATGNRVKPAKFFEVTNKSLDLSGRVTLFLTDTSFDGSERYGLFSPASFIRSGTTTSVTIDPSFSRPFGDNEWRKWAEFVGADVQIRSLDFSEVADSKISSISGNTITLSPALPFTPQNGYVMEFSDYDKQTNEQVKLLYTFNSDDDNPFDDGRDPYVYL
jgi:hypothetical protein